jgi:ribonucleotide reductase beta subunit family protein with ferritin-like domain
VKVAKSKEKQMEFIQKSQSKIEGMTVFNSNHVDTKKQPMFFGKPLGVQRYDSYKYPIFEKLTEQQLGFFWRPQEVSLQKDRADYATLRPEQKHIFTANLKYQIMLDSVQGRGPGLAFLPYCSLPELEACMTVWEMMEMVHSRSYTYIIKNVYPDVSEIFDTILDDANILQRASTVTKAYDELIQAAHQWDSGILWSLGPGHLTADAELKEIKRKLYRAIVNVNILEGIRFYVSFACSFAFGELKLMEGSAKIIGLIARDESQHLVITQNILKNWANGDDAQMLEIMKEEEETVYNMYRTAVEEEKAWADYLFKDGSMIGLNAKLLNNYVEWIANRRMKAIGLKPAFDISMSNNPLPWTEHWLNSKMMQNAPQETEIESYVIGGIKQDVKKDTFSGFKL